MPLRLKISKGRFLTSRLVKISIATSLVTLIIWLFCLPRPLFNQPLATVLLDREGQLLGASIAADEQWRIPAGDSISSRLMTAIVTFEDKRFYKHWGVDPRAIARAVRDNLAARTVVSGGSTISMQVIRLAQENPPRTVWQKVKESFMATRLEWAFDKQEILRLWCNNAPFGGNIVGVEAAAWRYYGRSAADLSWGEASTLAVLPNSPALIHPGRSRDQLLNKRNRLLKKLFESKKIDQSEYELALAEQLPNAPYPLPRKAPHLLQRLKREQGSGRLETTLVADIQDRISNSVLRHQQRMALNGINNAAALVVAVETGDVLAYVGNSGDDPKHDPEVDMVQALRSPGSLLKPLLYGLSLSEGIIGPKTLLADYPCSFRGFRPANFSNNFSGATSADEALSRSLNIPFVQLLRQFGIPNFHNHLKKSGFTTITRSSEHYGLSLILGGCEIKMEEIAAWFTGLARQQRFYYQRQGRYAAHLDWQPVQLLKRESDQLQIERATTPPNRYAGAIDAGSGYFVLEALKTLNRPSETGDWQRFNSSQDVAWKTGTSFGFRDAWAVGSTPDYVVAVWVGNADGEGRKGLVGVQAAAPLMFDIFSELPRQNTKWFERPYDDLVTLSICAKSGMLANQFCNSEEVYVPKKIEASKSCPYHQAINLTQDEQYQIKKECYDGPSGRYSWFLLPTRMEHFYQRLHPEYQTKPPWHPDCQHSANDQPIALLYPFNNGKISYSYDHENKPIPAIFKAAHRHPETEIHWHIDGEFLGSTKQLHTFEILTSSGTHLLTLVDENGQQIQHTFTVVE